MIHNQLTEVMIDRRQLPTRHHDGLTALIPNLCKSVYMKSFVFIGLASWNCLSPEIQLLPTVESFKAHLKRMVDFDEKLPYPES